MLLEKLGTAPCTCPFRWYWPHSAGDWDLTVLPKGITPVPLACPALPSPTPGRTSGCTAPMTARCSRRLSPPQPHGLQRACVGFSLVLLVAVLALEIPHHTGPCKGCVRSLERSLLLHGTWSCLTQCLAKVRVGDCPWYPPWKLGCHLDLLTHEGNRQGLFFPWKESPVHPGVHSVHSKLWRSVLCARICS